MGLTYFMASTNLECVVRLAIRGKVVLLLHNLI